MSGWIGVDLDCTLARWTEWVGPTTIGEPVPLMAARVRAWLEAGVDVRIVTARANPATPGYEHLVPLMVEAIRAWTLRHFGRALPVTCAKDFEMLELWDDRAVQVEPNTGRRADGKD
jgi:hypothetical protein